LKNISFEKIIERLGVIYCLLGDEEDNFSCFGQSIGKSDDVRLLAGMMCAGKIE
jgi:hypothetical protein